MSEGKTAAERALGALLLHQAAVGSARACLHVPPDGAGRLRELSRKTPALLSALLRARAELVGKEYVLAASQLRSRYLKLLALNNILQRYSKGADLRSRDWARLFVPEFRSNPTPGCVGYAAGELISFDSIARSGDFELAVTVELQELRDLGVHPATLNTAA